MKKFINKFKIRVSFLLFNISIMLVLLFFMSLPLNAQKKEARFFLMGDGEIHIKNAKTGKEAKVKLYDNQGVLNHASFEKIDEVFNFPTREKGENISHRLIFMLDYFSDLVAPNKVIILESGYRNHDYNTKIRDKGANAAKTSTHIDGLALDFYIEGVSGKKLWEIIREHQCCGVGHYGGNIVHLDAGKPRFWEDATSKVHTKESDYNRKIYLSTEYDRYIQGEIVRISFSSVSDFGFGIKREVVIFNAIDSFNTFINSNSDKDCIMINDRKSSRFIFFHIPDNTKIGNYKIKVDFCNLPFEQMPLQVFSNEFEIKSRKNE